jgi:hypothetical protein
MTKPAKGLTTTVFSPMLPAKMNLEAALIDSISLPGLPGEAGWLAPSRSKRGGFS